MFFSILHSAILTAALGNEGEYSIEFCNYSTDVIITLWMTLRSCDREPETGTDVAHYT